MSKIFISFLISLFLFGASSFATVKITSVSGSSNFDDSESKAIIFGGMAGTMSDGDCDGANGGITPCNNCTNNLTKICNTRRIFPTLKLRIEFQSDSKDGIPIATEENGTSILALKSSKTSVSKGNTAVVEIEWSEICDKIDETGSDINCETNFGDSMIIGIDGGTANDELNDTDDDKLTVSIQVHNPGDSRATIDCGAGDNGGICSFWAFPGDSKTFIKDIDPSDGFPSFNDIKISALRFMYSTVGFDDIDPSNNGNAKNLEIKNESASEEEVFIEPNSVDGLQNLVLHYFRIATIDQANNMADITDNEAIKTACGNLTPSPDLAAEDCPFTVMPDEVAGLLEDDFNCFIATATYGSSMASEVKTFRKFRSEILLTSKYGRYLNNIYYKYGPYPARFLSENSWAKPFARAILTPAASFAKLSLRYGIAKVITFVFFGLFFFILFLNYWLSRRKVAKS